MTEGDFDHQHVLEQCRVAVNHVIQRYGWQLLSVEEFVARTYASLLHREAPDPRRAAINVYCQCLYSVCSGAEGAERQELGFHELYRYLYSVSLRECNDLDPDLRSEAVNETLLRIWQKLKRYHTPGAFLAVAVMELRNVLRPWWHRPTVSVSLEHADGRNALHRQIDPEQQAISAELRERVRRCFEAVLRRQPRARLQLEAVWLKYIAGLDDETISVYIAKPIPSVYVLRSRGLRQLRTDPECQDLARELGLL